MRNLRKHMTYANVMATMAIVSTLGGTAFAAATITGRNIKDGTLLAADVKNGTLTATKLTPATRAAFKGPKGDKGATGLTGAAGASGLRGPTGPMGAKGDTGPPGEAAAVVTSFASRDTGFLVRSNESVPNPQGHAWYEFNCGGGNTTTGPCESDNGNQISAGVGVLDMIASSTMVLALQGMSKDPLETNHQLSSNNNVVVPWNNNLTGMATVTLLHKGPATGGPAIHERIECGLQYANASTPSTFDKLGEPQMVSAFGTREVVSMTIVGSKNLPAGTYNVRVVCSDMDYASRADHGWRFVRGNLTAMAARN